MKIFIGADHRGFELKNSLIDFLQSKNIRVEDMGNYQYDKEDDYNDYAKEVAKAVSYDSEAVGIVICGSGIGVAMQANRFKHVRAALGFNKDQVVHGRVNDHVNVLALPAEYLDTQTAEELVSAFLTAEPNQGEKYVRRVKKLDE